MKTTLFIILLVVTFSKTGKFLNKSNAEGVPIIFSVIEENTCQITRYQAKPDTVVPGESNEFKMQFVALENVNIVELYLDTQNNGVSLFTDHVDISKSYTTGEKDVVGYSAVIPSFCPSGSWDIYLYLKDSDGNTAATLLVHFDI